MRYLLRKWDWGMILGLAIPSQTVFGSIGYIYNIIIDEKMEYIYIVLMGKEGGSL